MIIPDARNGQLDDIRRVCHKHAVPVRNHYINYIRVNHYLQRLAYAGQVTSASVTLLIPGSYMSGITTGVISD